MEQIAKQGTAKLKKAPAYRFLVFIIMLITWAQIYIGMQTVAIYGTEIMADLDINNTTLSLISNGVTIALGVMCVVSGMVGARIGGKRTVVLGCIIQVVAGLLFFTNPTNVGFLIVIRIIEGVGGGLINAYAVSLISAWFPKKERSMASGLQMGMYGVAVSSTALFCSMFTNMGMTWAQGCGTFVSVAGIVCAIMVGLLYRDMNKAYGVDVIDDAIEGPDALVVETSKSEERKGVEFHHPGSYKEMFRSPVFWLLVIIIFGASGTSYNLGYLYPFVFPEFGYTPEEVTAILSVAMTGTIIAGPLGGVISDRLFKGQRSQTLAISFGLSAIGLVIFIALLGARIAVAGITIAAFLVYSASFLARGPMWSVPPQVMQPEFFVRANGVLLLVSNVAGLVFLTFSGALADLTGSYVPGLVFSIVFSVVSTICCLIMWKRYQV